MIKFKFNSKKQISDDIEIPKQFEIKDIKLKNKLKKFHMKEVK